MRVKLEHRGWCRAAPNIEYMFPHGYHNYLATAENGIIVTIRVPAGDAVIPDGEYEMRDEDWSYDNPKWEQMEERDVDYVWEVD